LTIDLKAEFDGVISIEVAHWKGALQKGPNFELFPDGNPPSFTAAITEADNGATSLHSGALTATIGANRHSFSINLHATDGSKELTSLLNRSFGFAYTPPPGNMKEVEDVREMQHYTFAQTELGIGESIHGLGERFGAFNKVGQHIEVWNEDG